MYRNSKGDAVDGNGCWVMGFLVSMIREESKVASYLLEYVSSQMSRGSLACVSKSADWGFSALLRLPADTG